MLLELERLAVGERKARAKRGRMLAVKEEEATEDFQIETEYDADWAEAKGADSHWNCMK